MLCMFSRRHQTHYEQFGCTTGRVEIEGHDSFDIKLRGVRDHSYGRCKTIDVHLVILLN